MVGKHERMNPCVDQQGVNVGKEAVEEISAEIWFSCFVGLKPVNEIAQGFIQDLDFHDSRLRMSALAVSQSENLVCPWLVRWRRSSRVSLCQAGDSMASVVRLRSFQRDSITASFSRMVMSLRGRLTDIGEV